MSEMNITIGETNKRRGRLKTALLAFAIVAALLVTPVVTAESANAGTFGGYATNCSKGKTLAVYGLKRSQGWMTVKNPERAQATNNPRVTRLDLFTTHTTYGVWSVYGDAAYSGYWYCR